MPLTSCDVAGAGLGVVAGIALCTGPGATFPSAGGAASVGGGGDSGGPGGGTVCGPATFGIAGTRGKENKSLTGGSTGAAAGDAPFSPSHEYGIEPGGAGMPAGVCGTAATSAPAGGDVGGVDGNAGSAGNKNSSFPGGRFGVIPNGEIFPPARKSGGEPGSGDVGAVPGVPGTIATAPANDAAIARRSVSVNGPGGEDGSDAGMLGADSTASVPRRGLISAVNIVVGIVSDSASAGTSGGGALSPFPRFLGITRKNSFASLSSVAGSGIGNVANGNLRS